MNNSIKTSWKTIKTSIVNFFEAPMSAKPLGIFRILMALFTLLQAFLWYPDWQAFLGQDGWLQWEISKALIPGFSIHMADVADWLTVFGLTAKQSIWVLFWVYVISAAGMLLGFYTRVWCILTWFCHYIIMNSIDIYVYGVDIFLHIALFYLMLMPVHKAYSLDVWLRKINTTPTWGNRFSIRVLQIHMCLAYISAGYEKMLSAEWWNGNVLWRSLVQPDFRQYDFTWLSNFPWILMALSWFTMIIEVGYCIAMWVPRLRIFWLAGIIMLHIGIGLFLGLWLFGLIMILLSISAFGYTIISDIRNLRGRKKANSIRPFSPGAGKVLSEAV